MDQNIDNSSFDQIQPPQSPVIHHPSQEMSEEVLQAKGNLMKSIQTFLQKFSRYPFGVMPKIELSFLEDQFQEDPPPEVPMADNQTMAELLQAPTKGYEDAIVIPKIAANNFELKHAVSSEVAELKDLVRALLLDKKNQSSALVSSSTP
nr:reverse transcriptase domain-containing protein [Tanacetum cinerariifolium]